MPKPLSGINGSGMHLNMSLFNDKGNTFYDKDGELEISQEAYYFLGGLLKHARSFTAVCNPIVNSYNVLFQVMKHLFTLHGPVQTVHHLFVFLVLVAIQLVWNFVQLIQLPIHTLRLHVSWKPALMACVTRFNQNTVSTGTFTEWMLKNVKRATSPTCLTHCTML